ncbi:MAG: hypothetical protein Ct9H90mP30_2050 [Actinomycetota bacterium]|nr:MAG: hypothetical protein Ct9H90mP30_2050 [Actinomycetota bacterium]
MGGASVFALMIPMAIVGPFAGPMADRLSRRKNFFSMRSAFSYYRRIKCIPMVGRLREPLIYVAVNVIYGIGNGYALPAWQAYVADLVPREFLMNAIL